MPGAPADWRHRLLQAFAVGVVSWTGQYKLISSGCLPEAVAASIAIPFIFGAVDIPGGLGPHLSALSGGQGR